MMKIGTERARWILKFSAAIALLGFMALMAPARAQAQVSLFGGYSYLRPSVPVGQFVPPGPPSISQNVNLWDGWELAGQYKFIPFVGMVADFSGNYGTLDGANVHVNTYLFGPQVSLPGRVSPFAHVLIGAAHERQDAFANGTLFSLGPDTSFATAVGGGIDVALVPFVAVRLIQIDYLHTDWHGRGQNQPRVSAGIVLHF